MPNLFKVIEDEKQGQQRTAPRADPMKEYISGGQQNWSATYLRTLTTYIDDISRDFGDDIYERMQNDAQIRACLELAKMAILGGGLSIRSCRKETEDQHELAVQVADFCSRNIDSLQRPFITETLHDMLDSLAVGSKVAEIVCEIRKAGPDKGKLCLKEIKVKPRKCYAFVVDAFLNCVGLLGLVPGSGTTLLTNSFIGMEQNLRNIKNFFPRKKFCVLTCQPTNGDLRGTSILRAAYDPWWLKQQVKAEYAKYLALFAMEKYKATTAEDAEAKPMQDKHGQPIVDDDGKIILVQPEEAMALSLADLRNGGFWVGPFGSTLDVISPVATGSNIFSGAFDFLDGQMAKAILSQTRATEEAQHGSRADSQTGQDLLGIGILFHKTAVVEMVRNDLLSLIVEANFGQAGLEVLPLVSLGDVNPEDIAAQLPGYVQAGYQVDPSQFRELDVKFKLTPRPEESIHAPQAMAELGLKGAEAAIKQQSDPAASEEEEEDPNERNNL